MITGSQLPHEPNCSKSLFNVLQAVLNKNILTSTYVDVGLEILFRTMSLSNAMEKLVGLVPLYMWKQQEAMFAHYRFLVSDKPEISNLIDAEFQRRWDNKEVISISLSDS